MERNRNEFRIGMAVLASLVVLVVGIMWGKGVSLKVRQYDFVVYFNNVQGLESGASVLANGLEKGRVHDIRLQEGKVRISASVDKDVKLYSDYRIIIESPTLLAGKVLSIYPGAKLPLADMSVPLAGSESMGMTEAVEIAKDISGDLKVALRNLNSVLVSLQDMVGDSTNKANIAGTLAEAHQTARLSSEWLHQNSDDLTLILNRVEVTIARADSLLQISGPKLNSTISQVDSAMVQLTEVSASLRRVLSNLESDESTAGKLLHDDELYQRLNRVLSEVDSLSADVRTRGLKMQHTLKIF